MIENPQPPLFILLISFQLAQFLVHVPTYIVDEESSNQRECVCVFVHAKSSLRSEHQTITQNAKIRKSDVHIICDYGELSHRFPGAS